MSELVFSQSPHIRSGNTTKKIMLNVCLALLPSCVMGIVYFGVPAALVILTTSFSAVAAEFVYRLIMGETFKDVIKTFDFSSLVTGLILALIMPATYHVYVPALGAIFAVVVGKMLFGGTGYNFVNPAAAGRIFAFISFTSIVDSFVMPSIPAIRPVTLAGASSLQSFLNGGNTLAWFDLLLGTGVQGCIGETCKVAILVGGIYLSVRGIIRIWKPLVAILIAGLTAVVLNGFDFTTFLPALLSGGLIFGAVFMATDYVTTPTTALGNFIYFAFYGVMVSLFRKLTGYETASFVLLLLNVLVPLIEKITVRKPFGYQKPQKETK